MEYVKGMSKEDLENLATAEIKETIDGLDECSMINIHNEYCRNMGYFDDEAINYEQLDDLCCGMSPTEIIEKYGACDGMEWFKFNGYGYPEEFSWADVDTETIAEYCVENEEDFYESDIREILDTLEELVDKLEEEDEEEEEEDEEE